MGNFLENVCCSKSNINFIDVETLDDYTSCKPSTNYNLNPSDLNKTEVRRKDLSKKWVQYKGGVQPDFDSKNTPNRSNTLGGSPSKDFREAVKANRKSDGMTFEERRRFGYTTGIRKDVRLHF
jgi:hypothetical protein